MNPQVKLKQFLTKITNNNALVVTNGVTSHPFFQTPQEGIILDFNTSKSLNCKQRQFLNDNFKSIEIKAIYNFIEPNKELYVCDYNFFSLDEIIKRSKNFPNFIDIGLKYEGMGHVIVISYYIKEDRFFLRRDGGSNGWDREGNHQFYNRTEYEPNNKSLFSFNNFFDVIESDINIEMMYDFQPVYSLRDT